MCRRNQLLGACAACFGFGMLISTCFESAFFCCCIGIIAISCGGVIIVKR